MRPVIPVQWDAALRASGAVAAAAIVVIVLIPALSDWAAFFSVILVTSGPTSTVMPVASEPFLIAFGQLHAPLLVALVGTAAIVLIEVVNYSLFQTALHAAVLRQFRGSRLTNTVISCFDVAPSLAVAFAAFSPIPFALVRALAALSQFPFGRYLTAMALGRLPRLWLIALVGSVLPYSPGHVLAVGVGAAVLVGLLMWRGRRRQLYKPAISAT